VRSFNLFDGELDEARDRPGFSWRRAAVGRKLGAEKIGASLYELQPGERTFPYHYEYGNEEWLVVVGGRPTLRAPDGEHELRPGDVVCFPEGPEGAHQVRNDTDEPIRVLIASTKRQPDAAVYPDSGKMGVWSGNEDADPGRLFRIGDAVDYWDGED
jgi:uncharacterized cupin superfamily protein